MSDPTWGTFTGKAAIAGFMTTMVKEMTERKIVFDLDELSGDGETAWARWIARTPDGDRPGCGIYKVRDGKLTYYRDYMDPPSKGG